MTQHPAAATPYQAPAQSLQAQHPVAPNSAATAVAPGAGAFQQAPSAPGSNQVGQPTQLTSLFDRLAKPDAPAAPVVQPKKQSIFQRLIR